MRGNELLEKMDLIDPEYVEAASTAPKKHRRIPGWLSAAACLPILLLAAQYGITQVLPAFPTESTPVSEQTQPPETTIDPNISVMPIVTEPGTLWSPVYNMVDQELIASDVRVDLPCYFAEPLSPEELSSITPEYLPDWVTLSGYAGFSGYAGMEGEPELLMVVLEIETDMQDASLSLQILKYDYVDCIINYEPVLSPWEGVDYTCYQLETSDGMTHLKAEAIRDDWTWRYVLSVPGDQVEQGREILARTVMAFAGTHDFSRIAAEWIPEYMDRTLTHGQALNDPDFGSYFPPQLPAGFVPERIGRYKDYRSDYLSGLWSRGYDDLYWRVSRITEDDRCRITAVDETENYDLSLYPIPRADSVPEELREIVDNPIFLAQELTLEAVKARAYRVNDAGDTDGWRMAFSVLYGDILVEIRAKGVEPEWVYHQLIDLLHA